MRRFAFSSIFVFATAGGDPPATTHKRETTRQRNVSITPRVCYMGSACDYFSCQSSTTMRLLL